MLLAIDVGNTNICFALFEGNNIVTETRLETKSAHDKTVILEAVERLYQQAQIPSDFRNSKVVIASVVPAMNIILKIAFDGNCKILETKDIPIIVDIPNPGSVGIDRLVDAYAAKKLYGAPAIVVDIGTATTFDVIDEKGRFMGGVIVPGPKIMAEALRHAGVQLPAISLEKPQCAIGNSTVAAMQIGAYWGYIGILKEIISRIQQDFLIKDVVITGGLASMFKEDLQNDFKLQYDRDLTLVGIRLL